jgi:hypothetical protein
MNKRNYRLVRDRKVIHEAFVWYNGTLGDISRTIGVVGVLLEDAMPMLGGGDMKVPNTSQKKRPYNRSFQVQGVVRESIVHHNF